MREIMSMQQKNSYSGELVACVANEHAGFPYSSIANSHTLDEPWSGCSHWNQQQNKKRKIWSSLRRVVSCVFVEFDKLKHLINREREREKDRVFLWRHFTWFSLTPLLGPCCCCSQHFLFFLSSFSSFFFPFVHCLDWTIRSVKIWSSW